MVKPQNQAAGAGQQLSRTPKGRKRTVGKPQSKSGPSLKSLGVFDFKGLEAATLKKEEYMVEGLFKDRSLNILVGDSGLGKTALAVQLGVSVASGKPFLGHDVVTGGGVLYCDFESGMIGFKDILRSVSGHLELSEPPKDFSVWNPYWDSTSTKSIQEQLSERVKVVKPTLVIVDPLRMFWPEALEKDTAAANMMKTLRKLSADVRCSWLLLHHIRKKDRTASTKVRLEDGQEWFEEAAGMRALINSTDTRLGVEKVSKGSADLTLAGFVRIVGDLGPFPIARDYSNGEPVGYSSLSGVDYLNPRYKQVFEKLSSSFQFKDVRTAGEMSSSSAAAFLEQCRALGLVKKNGQKYEKV